MQFFSNCKNKSISDWLHDNRMFMDAYYAAGRDRALKKEIEQLEAKYIRFHLVELVGEDDADRIMSERGY